MLRAMRQSAGSWMIKILLGIIVVAFVFMGAETFNAGRADKVATVNGELISIHDYQIAYDNMVQDLRRRFGDQFNEKMLEMLNIKQQVLDQLIDTAILHQTAEKEGIRVSKKELVASILQMNAFQDNNGAFDKHRYQAILAQNRLSPGVFESMQKESLLLGKLSSLVTGGVKVSDEEAREWYRWENTSVTIDYAVFAPDAFDDLQVSDAELQAYFDAHKESYMTEPKIKARYVVFDPSAYLPKIEVSKDEIQQYYINEEDAFRTAETVTARQILFNLPADAAADLVEKRREEAVALIQEARSGKDFVELAEKYSEEPAGEKGRVMGPLTRDEMLAPLADVAFELEIGEISDPVRTAHGWHILKIEGYEPSAVKPLEQVEEEIVKRLSEEKARDMAYDEAVGLYDISYTGDDLVKNIANRELTLITTDFFTKAKGPAGIAEAAAFARIAFEIPVMDISDVAEIGEAYYLIQPIEKELSHVPELEAVKEQVLVGAAHEKRQKAAEAAARQFFEKLKAGGDITALGEQEKVAVESAVLENRHKPSSVFAGDGGAVTEAAFTLSSENRLPEDIIRGGDKYYVIALKEKHLPPAEGYSMAKNSILVRLQNQKQSRLYDAWLVGLRKNSEIRISKKFMDEGADA